MTERTVRAALTAIMLGLFLAALALAIPGLVSAECEYYEPNPPNEPTGVKGCEVYGEGMASMWPGPGVARNDCVYPWDDCQPIRITVVATGAWVEVRPTMYCDCYTGTADQRIVDLPPNVVAALALDPAQGLWEVRVEPIGDVAILDPGLPNTALVAPEDEGLLAFAILEWAVMLALVIGWRIGAPRR